MLVRNMDKTANKEGCLDNLSLEAAQRLHKDLRQAIRGNLRANIKTCWIGGRTHS